jgi:hypothetical protein
MLQSEYLRLPVGAHIPKAYHEHLDRLARWVRGRVWLDAEADLILEAMLEYLDDRGPSIRHQYHCLCLRMATMSHMDSREYRVPSFQDFSHLIRSIPKALVRQCRIGPPAHRIMRGNRQARAAAPSTI